MIINTFQDLFRIISFLFFAALVIRSILRQGIPALHGLFNTYKQHIQDRIKTREKILSHNKDVKQTILNEHQEGLSLIDKVNMWRIQQEKLNEKKREEFVFSRTILYTYMKEQAHYLSTLTVQKKLIPEIESHVEKKIRELYSNPDAQKEYINHCIDSLPDVPL